MTILADEAGGANDRKGGENAQGTAGASSDDVRFSIPVRSWNRRVAAPKTLSVLCPRRLLDENGRRLDIETKSLRLGPRPGDVRVFAIPVDSRKNASNVERNVESFYFFPQDEPDADALEKELNGAKKGNGAKSDGGEKGENGGDANGRGEFDGDDAAEKSARSANSGVPEFFESPENPTRIRVPNDVVKMEDRLGYILQPPLETWFGRRLLEMPFEPFGYQKQGVAFLYGSQFAVLADEMGLGKTMQAITTIRLLFRSGECRRVLLVCPKPLV
ncbi:MAG: DEAD/DEAH box helicase, partial [Thermoguttaceae bacterium]|nr:DEAD/DEAH box helicase [Thermoguttaceae bacterium]